MKSKLRDPLVQFVMIGALIFAADATLNPASSDLRVTVSAEYVDGVRADWMRRTGQQPTVAEEAALVGQFVDEEVLYREALALGLDKGDLIVRRRLVQKMRFLTEGRAKSNPIGEDALREHVAANSAHYVTEARVRVSHVYFGDDAEAAKKAKTRIEREGLTAEQAVALGQPWLRGHHRSPMTKAALERDLGVAIAKAAFDADAGSWMGPIESQYGLHLVLVQERTAATLPSLDDPTVRAQATRLLRAERAAAANRAHLKALKAKYEIDIQSRANDRSALSALEVTR